MPIDSFDAGPLVLFNTPPSKSAPQEPTCYPLPPHVGATTAPYVTPAPEYRARPVTYTSPYPTDPQALPAHGLGPGSLPVSVGVDGPLDPVGMGAGLYTALNSLLGHNICTGQSPLPSLAPAFGPTISVSSGGPLFPNSLALHALVSGGTAPRGGVRRGEPPMEGKAHYGEPCEHRRNWKRLRAKRGVVYYLCMHCHAKWRIRVEDREDPPKHEPGAFTAERMMQYGGTDPHLAAAVAAPVRLHNLPGASTTTAAPCRPSPDDSDDEPLLLKGPPDHAGPRLRPPDGHASIGRRSSEQGYRTHTDPDPLPTLPLPPPNPYPRFAFPSPDT